MQLRGRQTQFYIDLLYGLGFAGGFVYLVQVDMDPLVAAFQSGLVFGYFLRVWEKMSVYERILQEEAEEAVAEEVEQTVPEEVERAVAAEAEQTVPEEVERQVPEEMTDEIEERVGEEVDDRFSEEIDERVTEEVEEQIDDRPALPERKRRREREGEQNST